LHQEIIYLSGNYCMRDSYLHSWPHWATDTLGLLANN